VVQPIRRINRGGSESRIGVQQGARVNISVGNERF
jgi:hypothetical protein